MSAVESIFGSKGGAANPTQPVEAPDDLRSIAKAKILLALGEGEFVGELDGKSIYLDGTPLLDSAGNENFPGVKWDFRSGTQQQSYIPGVPSVENEVAVGVELTSDQPWIRAVNNSQLSAVRIRFRWPALQKVASNGDVNGYRIAYAIDVATDGGSYATVLNTAVDGKTTQAYERSHRIDLPQGSSWQVRVRRLTANQNNNQTADTMIISAITDVIDRKFRYPNTALLYVEFDASQFQNIPTISCEPKMRVVRVPTTYDPETRQYTGIWDGSFKLAWTDNPAWICYDLIVEDRFGCGRRLNASMIDKWELYNIAQYCDQLVSDGKGGMEPRYTCNIYIQQATEAWQVLRDIASIFRGMTYWSNGQMYSVADMPRDIDFIYTSANVIDGKFSYSGSSQKVKYTRALISWDDPNNGYESDVTSSNDQALQRRYGDNPLEIPAIGCVHESEAQRRGKWAIYTNNNDRGILFKVGMDGQIPLPGYVIGVADPLIAGRRIGGRISAVSGNTITLDKEAVAAVNDRLILNLPSGKSEARTIQSVSGRDITVTTAYSETPVKQLVWSVETTDLVLQQFKVIKVVKADSDDIQYEITAVQHDPGKYPLIDSGARLELRPISVLPVGAQTAPASVTILQNVYIEQTLAITVMTIEWEKALNAVAYDVEWRKDNGEWIKVPRTGNLSIDISGVYTGQYLARVRAVNSADVTSVPRSSVLTEITGKSGQPPALVAFTASPLVFGIRLDWDFAENSADTLRTEIEYSSQSNGSGALKLGDYAYPISNHTMAGIAAGVQFFFRARVVDRSGNLGPWTVWVPGQSSTSQSEYDQFFSGRISETALAENLLSEIEQIPLLNSTVQQIIIDIAPIPALELSIEQIQSDIAPIPDIQTRLDLMESQLADVIAAPDWDPAIAYLEGQLVKNDGGLYRARTAVPAGTLTTNTSYWEKIGDYDSLGEAVSALAVRLNSAETSITNIDDQLVAQSSRMDGIFAQINPPMAGSTEWKAGSVSVAAGVWSEQYARASNDEALGFRIDTVAASVGSNAAAIQQEATARSDADSALASQITTVQTAVGDNAAAIQQEATARSDADSALASQITTVQTAVADNAAAIQQEATARADADSALASQITTVQTAVGDNAAAIQQEATARADADSALASQITTVQTAVGDNAAAIQQEATARADADSALASQITTVQTAVGDNAAAIQQEVTARADADSAQSSRIDGIFAQINPPMAGSSEWKAGSVAVVAGVWSEQHARASSDEALGFRIDTVAASVGSNAAAIQQEATARANADSALGQTISTVQAAVGQNAATIQNEATARADADSALANQINTVQATAGQNTAAIQTTSEALADLNGNLSAMWSVKLGVTQDGKYYAAGIGLGIENTDVGLQSQFLVWADRFAIINQIAGTSTITTPFVVQGGQTFINQALIGDAWITNAMIGNVIQSNDYVAGSTGWQLNKNGNFEINGPVAGQGRLFINNEGIKVFDSSGVARIEMGLNLL